MISSFFLKTPGKSSQEVVMAKAARRLRQLEAAYKYHLDEANDYIKMINELKASINIAKKGVNNRIINSFL